MATSVNTARCTLHGPQFGIQRKAGVAHLGAGGGTENGIGQRIGPGLQLHHLGGAVQVGPRHGAHTRLAVVLGWQFARVVLQEPALAGQQAGEGDGEEHVRQALCHE
jgi:hypothetical protein